MKIEQILDRNSDNVHIRKFVTFRVNDEHFAIDILEVQEVILYDVVTPVPRTPDFVMGVINLRNKVIPVVDLRLRLEGQIPPSREDSEQDQHVIVINLNSITLGLIVDQMGTTLQIREDRIEPPPENWGKKDVQFISGIISDHNKLYIMPDLYILLDVQQMTEV